MRNILLKILLALFMVTHVLSMDLSELKIKLESGNDLDFVDVADYLNFDVIKNPNSNPDEKIKIARILYDFRDQEVRSINPDGDVFYTTGKGWVISRMAHLTSYESFLPNSIKEQYLPSGLRIDPIGNLTYDTKAQERYLSWYRKKFLNTVKPIGDGSNEDISTEKYIEKDAGLLQNSNRNYDELAKHDDLSIEKYTPLARVDNVSPIVLGIIAFITAVGFFYFLKSRIGVRK